MYDTNINKLTEFPKLPDPEPEEIKVHKILNFEFILKKLINFQIL